MAQLELVSESNRLTEDTGNEPELTLEQKLDACRQLGCNAGQVWREGQQEILVDGLFLSIEEFKRKALKSFKELQQPCLTGLNLCRDAIARVKQKIATARANKLEANMTLR